MKSFALVLLAAAPLIFTGCENPNGTVNHTGSGALIGAGGGAAIGALAGGRNAGPAALIGGALGAVTGAIVGSAMDENDRERLRAQAPQTYERIEQAQPLYPNDIKNMAKSGVSDEVIISQIHATRSVYHLSAPDIIDLNQSGVSQNVINAMINTATGAQPPPEVSANTPPPAPQTEVILESPGPGYVWVGGEWVWHGRWVWAPGHYVYGPRPGAVWVGGVWVHGRHGYYHRGGYWRY